MLRKLRVVNYRSFRDFTITFPTSACLVGPNNAGKSTILTALRLADEMLRVAHARKPSMRSVHHGIGFGTFPISLREFPSLQESLRHEFHTDEASLELVWKSGNRLVAVWPEEDEYDEELYGFFYLQMKSGSQPAGVAETRQEFPRLGIVPPLSPLDHTEHVLTDEYLRRNISSRLSSRHFRNNIDTLRRAGTLDDFRQFAAPWLPGLSIDDLSSHETDDGRALDLYISEAGSRVPKEVIWAGDGIQIWLQILFHLYRLREYGAIVLDEPDVYLHADLQRRLVQLLESTSAQTIVATHSTEMVAESPKANVVWVDKTRRRASAIKDESLLEKLSNTLGSQFNLKLARAMRSRVLLMVEGKDMQVLRRISRTLGAQKVASEDGVAVVQIQGFSGNEHIDPFKWIIDEFLDGAVECFVLLDRDYRPDVAIARLEHRFKAIGVHAHVWRRKELESYLLEPDAIARLSGATPEFVSTALAEIVCSMEDEIFSRMLDEHSREVVSDRAHRVTVTTAFRKDFEEKWARPDWRLLVAPPKQVLSALNARLQGAHFRTVSSEKLAGSLTQDEIASEMRFVLEQVDEAAQRTA